MKQVFFALIVLIFPASVWAQEVFFLGETHDNPGHHSRQADRVAQIAPKALVFEMLTAAQANKVTKDVIGHIERLEQILGWENSGWPDFAMYYPIFSAAPQAQVFGAAVPREDVRRLMSEPIEAVFGPQAVDYGLMDDLPQDQQELRETMQQEAHCNALPDEMLPMMVGMQRLRDAALARAVIIAMQETGGPVVVITGNGHARKDWGAPAVLAIRSPDLALFSLGQGEEGAAAPTGEFDEIAFSAPAEREDPCNAFK